MVYSARGNIRSKNSREISMPRWQLYFDSYELNVVKEPYNTFNNTCNSSNKANRSKYPNDGP